MSYALLDSGFQEKLEQVGPLRLIRPCAQAVWERTLSEKEWKAADMRFTREGGSRWIKKGSSVDPWIVTLEGLKFELVPTDFGHLGIFPEHASQWAFMQKMIKKAKREVSVLNLFAYTGGATFAAAKAGAKVCHLDASKTAVSWARKNAELNGLIHHPIRWIIDDVLKFLKREITRGQSYDGIILDPPSFGRGRQGEVFKIERDLLEILQCCKKLLSKNPLFMVFTSHTPGFSPMVMNHLLKQTLSANPESGELRIPCQTGYDLPSGCFARWHADL